MRFTIISATALSYRRCTSLPRCFSPPIGTISPRPRSGPRTNASVLVDTHWIGGDPAELEIYGWASWSPAKAILVLRNPSDHEQSIDVDIARALELPRGAAQGYAARSPWKDDAANSASPIVLAAGQPHRFTLAPFQVLVLEAIPVSLSKKR